MTDGELPLICAAPNKRPERTEEMRREAAAQIVDEMIKHAIIEADERDGAIDDVVKATRYETDGYKIARELERKAHWDCDFTMAEMLDEFSIHLEKVYDAHERRWAAENPQEPRFRAGDRVMWRGKPVTIFGENPHHHVPYSYWINEGSADAPSYRIVPFEDVLPAPAEAAP